MGRAGLPQLLDLKGNVETIVFGVLMMLLLHRTRQGLMPALMSALARWLPALAGPAGTGSNAVSDVIAAPPLPVRSDRPGAGEPLLAVRGLSKRFGGLVAVKDMAFELRAGEILGLIGPNGAGKSTVFNLVSGTLAADGGEVTLRGRSIAGLPSREIARRGLARSFQHVHLVSKMCVSSNAPAEDNPTGARA